MIEVMQNSMMNDFEDQRSDKVTLFSAEPSAAMRLFNTDWVRRLEVASKDWADENARLTFELEDARTTQIRLESRVRELGVILRDWVTMTPMPGGGGR